MEPVGDIEGGILACCWTNDQEILLIVTAIGSLVLLNNSFEEDDQLPSVNLRFTVYVISI